MFTSNRICLIKLKEVVSLQLKRKPTHVLTGDFRTRCFCDKKDSNKSTHSNNNRPTDTDNIKIEEADSILDSKYKIFQESDAPVLLDVYEEKMQLENKIDIVQHEQNEYHGLNLDRGVLGVYDIEDLVELLRRDKAEDIFVAKLPAAANYVDHIVVVNGRSKRHMTGMAERVRRVFKKKRMSSDILPRIEGEGSSHWMALDLGNIALHIFSRDARQVYDLESLWSVGTEFDTLANAPDDPLIALLKKHAISLNDITSKAE
ncbi:uncharacterized protein LOC124364595 [Homalodisca vitripennis]|uniref:uncharacterized protein LOC124364595 n=1 Tax=Homalodisca vitripennis TaxID=197043 RepID=UPI001EECDFFA|nr:uncharacterized protein LOC124364595 [Homalodisca vitripennis]